MKRSKICIVGNGSSVLKTRKGFCIDQFETVGRINNYTTAGYEHHIGSKTSIWFNGANQKLKKRDLCSETVVVLIPSEILKRKGPRIHKRIKQRLNVPSQDSYTLVSPRDMELFEKSAGNSRLTTGTSAILWASEHFEEVYLHGFDFFIDSKAHYNDSPVTRFLIDRGIIKKAQKHDTQKEKEYITSLIEKGIIHTLH